MAAHQVDASTTIANKPEAIMSYIAEVRNRPLYLAPLKAVTDIKGEGAGASWKWVWVTLGMEFQGTGRSLKYEPGKLYSFKTEGGIASTWTYTAAAEGKGTRLNIRVEYEVPERAQARGSEANAADAMKKGEAERALQNLKIILDQ
jgi:Polyketide cyclase / dehydrase and lipid transport